MLETTTYGATVNSGLLNDTTTYSTIQNGETSYRSGLNEVTSHSANQKSGSGATSGYCCACKNASKTTEEIQEEINEIKKELTLDAKSLSSYQRTLRTDCGRPFASPKLDRRSMESVSSLGIMPARCKFSKETYWNQIGRSNFVSRVSAVTRSSALVMFDRMRDETDRAFL